MRGALYQCLAIGSLVGIIPARAGSTALLSCRGQTLGDHPRSCGEHSVKTSYATKSEGSSPLVRGALGRALGCGCVRGIIPARAGSTRYVEAFQSRCWDHPRSCGEHLVNNSFISSTIGSSPLVRGALAFRYADSRSCRIIPARAGSTPPYRTCRRLTRDHPRSCGEHHAVPVDVILCLGSSPLVRGARWNGNIRCIRIGIIPARAGSTLRTSPCMQAPWDHPRSCGEHPYGGVLNICILGSSPLVRGARRCTASRRTASRIIPARAGSTRSSRAHRGMRGDHPRSCGEHTVLPLVSIGVRGSSPLVRGALFPAHTHSLEIGIIPARAGSTNAQVYPAVSRGDHPRSCGEHSCTPLNG